MSLNNCESNILQDSSAILCIPSNAENCDFELYIRNPKGRIDTIKESVKLIDKLNLNTKIPKIEAIKQTGKIDFKIIDIDTDIDLTNKYLIEDVQVIIEIEGLNTDLTYNYKDVNSPIELELNNKKLKMITGITIKTLNIYKRDLFLECSFCSEIVSIQRNVE